MNEKKIIKAVIIVQIVILFSILVVGAFSKYSKSISPKDMLLLRGSYDEQENIHISENDGYVGSFMSAYIGALDYGSYTISIDYSSTWSNLTARFGDCDIMNEGYPVSKKYISHDTALPFDSEHFSYEVFVNRAMNNFAVVLDYDGNCEATIKNISIEKNYRSTLRVSTIIAFIFLAFDFFYIIYKKIQRGEIKEEFIENFLVLGGIVFFTSLPALLPYLTNQQDTPFHLLRIEGLMEGIKDGQFPVKLQSIWNNGNGYGVSFFYGDLFLFIPVVFRFLGFSITESYNIFTVIINAATAYIAYYTMKKMSGSRVSGLTGAFIYTASLYRLIDLYLRGAVGEYISMTFIPLLVYGFWKVFTDDVKAPGYYLNSISVVVALTALINCHILSCEMVSVFIIALCIIEIKKVIRKETFFVLAFSAVVTLLINLFFIVPFFDMYFEGGLNVTDTELFAEFGVDRYSTFLGQLFIPFISTLGAVKYLDDGMNGEMAQTIGVSSIICVVIVLHYLFVCREKKYKKTPFILLIFGLISVWFGTACPWDTIKEQGGFINDLVKNIQFPWRFFALATVCFTMTAVYVMGFYEKNKKNLFSGIVIVLTLITMFQAGSLISLVMNESDACYVFSLADLDSSYIIGGEYMPPDVLNSVYSSKYVFEEDGLECTQISRNDTNIVFEVSNPNDTDKKIHTSDIYYKGYVARNTATKEKLQIFKSDPANVGIITPANYSGVVELKYEGPWYWKLSYIASFICLIGYILLMCIYRKKELVKIKEF